MKQINPLYLSAFLGFVFLLVMFKLTSAQADQELLTSELQKTQRMGKRIEALKKSWGDSSQSKRMLLRLVKSGPLRNSGLVHEAKASVFSISSNSLNTKALDYLLNKVLNESYRIKNMRIQYVDTEHVTLNMEIAL